MKTSTPTSELLSLLADSELDSSGVSSALEACGSDDAALACWDTYHLIGDALRHPGDKTGLVSAGTQLAFLSRLNRRLDEEGPIKALSALEVAPELRADPASRLDHRREGAANDGTFRWKLVAGVASMVAVSAILLNVAGLLAPAASPQLAQAPFPQVVVASPQGMMVRDARLDELLAAHKQFGAGSALQESSGLLQNTAFDAPRSAVASGAR